MFPIFLGNDPRGKTMGIKALDPSIFETLATIVAGIPDPTSIDSEASRLDKNPTPYFDESIAETETPLHPAMKNDWQETI
jgi:hypothetical protein